MKSRFKKFIIVLLCLQLVFTCNSFSYADKKKKVDIASTDYDFDKSPNQLYSGKFLVMGDSYALLMVENTVDNFNYIVHAGYDVSKIYFELLPPIKKNTFDYVFLFLGPNDYMEQVDPQEFMFVLGMVVDELKSKGMQVIMTDYVDPHYDYKVYSGLDRAYYHHLQYDNAVKEIIIGRDCIYVPYEDLFRYYGYRNDKDLVHPNDNMYEPLLTRIKAKIDEDMSRK